MLEAYHKGVTISSDFRDYFLNVVISLAALGRPEGHWISLRPNVLEFQFHFVLLGQAIHLRCNAFQETH